MGNDRTLAGSAARGREATKDGVQVSQELSARSRNKSSSSGSLQAVASRSDDVAPATVEPHVQSDAR